MYHLSNISTLLLQLLFFTLTSAAPLGIANNNNHNNYRDPFQYGLAGGTVGFVILVLDIIVWIEVLQSTRPVLHKVAWSLFVFVFPVLGIIIYFLFSDRVSHQRGYERIT